ncbi:ATP-binding protein [Roseobacter sp. HKCCA0434]|uniref:ATP-binding protein n=1 Tax=Roseobacter sp. HKCCA0434 TaxID=3079297 RepID=UPI002905B592|nr:ATP-binding protein [Roseobacter sp. HKCCA0434]
MDPVRNPFSPSAGRRPPELAGRDDVLDTARTACLRAMRTRYGRPMMMLGLRGTGKTVLINEIKRIAADEGLLTSRIEAPENADLARLLVPELRKVLRSLSTREAAREVAVRGLRGLRNLASIFKMEVEGVSMGIEGAADPEPGLADSGDLQFDLPDLFEAVGEAARRAGTGWMLLIDEVQYLNREDLSALIVGLHRVSQSDLPILFVGAGLPQVAKLAGDAKSYAERLFTYPRIDALEPDAARQAIVKPVEEEGATIEDGAVAHIVEKTRGYPFYLQAWGDKAWDIASDDRITVDDVRDAYAATIASLDEGFFRVRLDRLTRGEVTFVAAMSELGDGPYAIADIAAKLDRKPSSLGPARANILKKGMIYNPDHGYLDFSVPLFAEFMRRLRGADPKET